MNQQFLNDLPKDIKQAMSRAGTAGIGVHSARHGRLISEYYQLQSDGARGAFAISWVKGMSKTLNETWPVLYDLLRAINEHEHYKNPQRTGGDVYESFQEFFERTVEQPFETWKELEDTYHFVQENAPHLLEGTFADARNALKNQGGQPGNNNASANHNAITKNEDDNYNVRFSQNGTSADYLSARIARDRPDILEDMKQGKYRSVRQAAIEAGIIHPRQRYSLPDDPQAAGRYLAQRIDDDWMRAMVDAYEDACDAALAKERREAYERGEMETTRHDA